MVSMHELSDSSGATSPSLLVKLKVQDSAAWARFVDLYGPLVFHWARRHSLSDEDSADLLQEVFAAVARSIDRFDPMRSRGRFRGWLWTITRNKIRDQRRRTGREVSPEQLQNTEIAFQTLPDDWSDDSSPESLLEVHALVRRALELIRHEFQAQTWDAFWGCVIDEQPTSEVAARLGLTENNVRQAKSRVLRRLRAELGDLEN